MSNLILGPVWKMKLKPSPKFVAVSLADQANDDGFCWPGVASISKRTGISHRTVQESLRYLESIRLITVVERPGKSNGYQFNMEMIRQSELFDGVDTDDESRKGVRNPQGCEIRRGANLAPRGAKSAGEGCESRTQTINNPQEPSGGRSAPARQRIRVPDDWRPSATTVTRCKDAGYPDVTDGEITGFIANRNATARTYDSEAAIEHDFISWMHKATRFNAKGSAPVTQGGSSRYPAMPNYAAMPVNALLDRAAGLSVRTTGLSREEVVAACEREWRRVNRVPERASA